MSLSRSTAYEESSQAASQPRDAAGSPGHAACGSANPAGSGLRHLPEGPTHRRRLGDLKPGYPLLTGGTGTTAKVPRKYRQ